MNVIFSLTKNLDRFIQHNWNIRFDNKPWTRGTPFFFFFGTHQPLDFGSPNPPGLILSRSDLIASSRLLEHAILYIAACCGSKRFFFARDNKRQCNHAPRSSFVRWNPSRRWLVPNWRRSDVVDVGPLPAASPSVRPMAPNDRPPATTLKWPLGIGISPRPHVFLSTASSSI